MTDENKLLKQYFKLYLKGKELYEIDKDKSFNLLKESLIVLDTIKKKNYENNEYLNILQESEIECYKLIEESIESNIESEIILSDKININILFDSLEKGDISYIKNLKYGEINFNIINNKSILHYAIKYSDTTFLKYAFKLGARVDVTDCDGHTLLEYACLELDPNMINFLIKYGADMNKHLYFRKGNTKFINNYDSIDILILYKILLSYYNDDNIILNTNFINKIVLIKNLLNINEKIGLNNYTIEDLFNWILFYISNIEEYSANDYLNIILEELNFTFKNKLGCPKNKIEIILINLVPFIENFSFNLSIDWLISLELKYLIIYLIRNKKTNDIKIELINNIWNTYIKNNIIKEDYIGILISQWVSKIKV